MLTNKTSRYHKVVVASNFISVKDRLAIGLCEALYCVNIVVTISGVN